ncbi:FAD-dependent oxidoreductase [Actinomadura kijaniata]|uniref:Glycine/D-amino acid oxidase-like deaminating enzyme n=1 Tax=Actinomadura namibiensis TaxID=182080 RepID=A0A7W3QJE1_ACTNM|nr:FAD-dependent oxidoreductase [Actinomadura namibiensis]MBA8949379.1 glycine/D-amino acid oxidase-like deaminating enzyme [Actinomadura namibiensis]
MNALKALTHAEPSSYWLTDPSRPDPGAALAGRVTCDLAVVGGGYTGLWTALRAKERDPSLDVVVLEADRVGGAASGRNGGFCAASLTHGIGNGLDRWPDEMPVLERLGRENLVAIGETLERYGVDAEWELTGEMNVATEEWQMKDLQEVADRAAELGWRPSLLGTDEVRAEVNSPTYVGALWDREGVAMVNPAKLAWGLADACRSLGVRVHENTRVTSLRRETNGDLRLGGAYGSVTARKVALGTGVFPPLLKRLRHFLVPVYDYAMVTEPLTPGQREAIGWRNRQGLGDSANQFHYYRLTSDDRILWGGYDAIYHFGNDLRSDLERRPETFATLSKHFFTTFPQLEGVQFTHTWGGVIDTCSRFCAFFGTAYDDRLAYAVGYTGLGVGATRFGADVMLDRLGVGLAKGEETERTRLRMVRTKPVPFPPEPLRYAAIELTRREIARADRNGGRRGLWLKTLDRFGLGFDS